MEVALGGQSENSRHGFGGVRAKREAADMAWAPRARVKVADVVFGGLGAKVKVADMVFGGLGAKVKVADTVLECLEPKLA